MKYTLALAAVLIAVTIASIQPVNAQSALRKVVSDQAATQDRSAQRQAQINALDDAARESLNEYRQAMAQITDLDAYNDQLAELVVTQKVELADFERRFQDIETTKRQILPLILRMLEVLDEFVAMDIPFLPKERAMRISELEKLMARPDVPTSEKYRRVSEAYQVELEYGHTIESYEGEIEIGGAQRTVSFLRFGRLGLYYMTLDGLSIGHWDKSQDSWAPLDDGYRPFLDRAMRIARKQLPPDLTRLPIPAPQEAE